MAALADERVAVAVKWLTDGSPDLHFELDWMAAAGDKVTVWLYGSGTNTGDWTFPPSAGPSACQPLPPTNRSWRAACSATYRVADGRIVDLWLVWDWFSVLDQLGVVGAGSAPRDQ